MQPFLGAALLGGNLLDIPSAINIISGSAATIYSIIGSVSVSSSNHLADLNEFIKKSDIGENLKTYTALLSEMSNLESETITICINNIKNTIEEIEMEMIAINMQKKYNDSLYVFISWRSYSFKKNVQNLTELVSKLEKRINILKISYEILSSGNNINDLNINKIKKRNNTNKEEKEDSSMQSSAYLVL
ncbi:MAG: hypothetical protein Terrestrivirus5_85 [Terrestrivirus sp.]|uniref:Uncharacterized protein n=1 Tax=Terrestrivirus sp. TaxID=2487775 RepID=A0A3G4ZRP0_9VIRU|nr:MAG: hypothetical protein Terrestrivirus5_85 [Terrestrivirus sp.]